MRRKRNVIEIFSLSALDLFASALGAFVIITAILIPYYPNMKEGGKTVERLIAAIKSTEAETAAALKDATEAEKEALRRKLAAEKAKAASDQKAKIEQQASAFTRENASLESEIGKLQATLDGLRQALKKKKKKIAPAAGTTDFSILGITTKAKSIVLVVDLSGSMNQWGKLLIQTLNEIISPFEKDMKFAIIGYQGSGVTRVWPAPRQMAWADARSKASARRFIAGLPAAFNGGTPTEVAMLNALGYRPDAIILISDGAPTGGRKPDQIIANITRLNRSAEINTVALGDYLKHSSFLQFLNNLAKRNRGSFVGVLK